jgi:hypothetical protein
MPISKSAGTRLPVENADTVSLICALLARFPELSSIRSRPADGTVRLTFAAKRRLDRASQRQIAEVVEDHVNAFVPLSGEMPAIVRVECESERAMGFIHVTRDLDSFSKEELEMLGALFLDRFGDALVRSSRVEEGYDDDEAAQDEAALYAIEALRDPTQSKNLVGFREEKRVLVYFLKNQKKAKASARR